MKHPSPSHAADTLHLPGRSPLGWQTLLWTGAVVLALYVLGIARPSLWWGHDEPYVAGIMREMATSGDFVVPTLNGAPYLEKPPLAYALGALACRAFGTFSPWVLRLPSALLALAATLWTGFVAWRIASARAAAWAGFSLATSLLFFTHGQSVGVDMALTASVTFALGLAYLAIVEPFLRQRWVPWFWVALTATFMAKGVVGPAMVLGPLGLTCLIRRDRRLAKAFLEPNWGMAFGAALTGAWIGLLWQRGARVFLEEVFLRNSVGRFLQDPTLVPATGVLGEHLEPWHYYLSRTPVNLLPWTLLWVAALGSAIPRLWQRHVSPRATFLPQAMLVNLLLFSLSLAKREVYLLPVLPIAFLHMAVWLDRRASGPALRRGRPLKAGMAATLVLVSSLALGLPWLLVKDTGLPAATAVATTILVLALAAHAIYHLRKDDPAGAFQGAILQWTVFLAIFLCTGAPALDRVEWRPLMDPYANALDLRSRGAWLAGAELTEAQLGMASLTLREPLPLVRSPKELRDLLGRPGPVAVLVKGSAWEAARAQGVPGTAVATAASALPENRRDRAPVLVVNASGKELLEHPARLRVAGPKRPLHP